MNKKGDASIVATVLLIIAAIAVAVLVTTFSKQTEEKVSERIVTLGTGIDCEDTKLSIEKLENNLITIKNRGTLSVRSSFLRVYGANPDRIDTFEEKFETCPGDSIKDNNLLPQKECDIPAPSVANTYKIEIIPVIPTEEGDLACENKISTWIP